MKGWSDLDHTVLSALADGVARTAVQIAEDTGLDVRHVHVALDEHERAGRLDVAPCMIRTTYRITPAGRASLTGTGQAVAS